MGFLIRGKSLTEYCTHYKGVMRQWPSYQPQFPADHEVNEAYAQCYKEFESCGEISDLSRAEALVEIFNRHGQRFEIAQIIREESAVGQDFLGFDVCNNGFSTSWLLWLNFCSDQWEQAKESPDCIPRDLSPLLELLVKYFAPRLNENGLFNTKGDGVFCLECMVVLQKLHPGIWEDFEDGMVVIGLSLVKPPQSLVFGEQPAPLR